MFKCYYMNDKNSSIFITETKKSLLKQILKHVMLLFTDVRL